MEKLLENIIEDDGTINLDKFELLVLEQWCKEHDYSNLFEQDEEWWAFPPGAVMPVPIKMLARDYLSSKFIALLRR